MTQVPQSLDERRRIHQSIENLPVEKPLSRHRLEELAQSLVQDEAFVPWTMVLIGSHFWKERVTAVPYSRRLLLLPHCLKSDTCPGQYNAEGLQCIRCGRCELGRFKELAEALGMPVLIAEGSPVVMQKILTGQTDAILGVGCLRSLEKAFDKLQLAGIPALAVPLHGATCKDSVTDNDWVTAMIQTPYAGVPISSVQNTEPTYLHLLRGASRLFVRTNPAAGVQNTTENIAFDFLHSGGKFYRPFITLAVFDALTGSNGTVPDSGEEYVAHLPGYVQDAARCVEVFHKASLVHDDIEDGDPFRYGQPAIHQTYGTAQAINIGDYLLGYGYHLIAELRHQMAPEIVAEMFGVLSSAHRRLCEGQGEELFLTPVNEHTADAGAQLPLHSLTPAKVLTFYVKKTAPAFEAALCLGALSAIQANGTDWQFYRSHQKTFYQFAKHIGAAFQIKNDLDDWQPEDDNKITAAGDALKNRPTLLRALAEGKTKPAPPALSVEELEHFYETQGIFLQARDLIRQFAGKAYETISVFDVHPALKKLLEHFTNTFGQ
ncbi:polyprenyl synthetase [Planctomycetales bacterium]|nr:polyprenyl synthetase [Planctomycetales bacterium]